MADGVEGAVVLDVDVVDASLVDERGGGRGDELVVLGGDDGDLVAGLGNGLAVVESVDGIATSREVDTGLAAKFLKDRVDERVQGQNVSQLAQVGKGGAVGGRRKGNHSLDNVGDALDFGRVDGLEGALGVADQINLGGARLALDVADKVGDLLRRLVDRLEAADKGKAGVVAVGQGEGAELVLLEKVLEEVDVFVVGGTEAVEEHDGVGMDGRLARVVIVLGDGAGGEGRCGDGRGEERNSSEHGDGLFNK